MSDLRKKLEQTLFSPTLHQTPLTKDNSIFLWLYMNSVTVMTAVSKNLSLLSSCLACTIDIFWLCLEAWRVWSTVWSVTRAWEWTMSACCFITTSTHALDRAVGPSGQRWLSFFPNTLLFRCPRFQLTASFLAWFLLSFFPAPFFAVSCNYPCFQVLVLLTRLSLQYAGWNGLGIRVEMVLYTLNKNDEPA